MFIIEFSYNFLYVWNCMKLYEKKLPIYENCMISIFGQPGSLVQISTAKLFLDTYASIGLRIENFAEKLC